MLVASKARLSIAMPVILLCISLLLFESRDYSTAQSSPVGLMNLHKVWGVLGAAALATAYLMKWGVSRRIGTPNFCLLILLLCALVSFLTSTQSTVIGGWKLIEWVSVFIVAVYMVTAIRRGKVEASFFYGVLFRFLQLLSICIGLGLVFTPSAALTLTMGEASLDAYGPSVLPFQLNGVFPVINPNGVGAIASLLLFVYLLRWKTGRRGTPEALWILLAGSQLVMAQSRTALVAFACAYVVITLLNPRRSVLRSALFIGVCLFLAIVFSGRVWLYLNRGLDVTSLAKLSGRVVWWETAFTTFAEASAFRQAFGLGFYDASRQILADQLDAGGASTLHSDYVDALISCGWVGLVVFVTGVCSALRSALTFMRRRYSGMAFEYMGVLIILVVRSLTGPAMFSYGTLMLLFYTVASLVSCGSAISSVSHDPRRIANEFRGMGERPCDEKAS